MGKLPLDRKRLSRALAALLICSAWGAALRGQQLSRTPIRDTLFNADGSLVEGVAHLSWKSFTAIDGSTVSNSSVDVSIINGVISVDLTPNEGATPTGMSYRVDYTLDNGNRFTEIWIVPESSSPVTVSDVRVALPPLPGATISQAQVSGLLAALSDKASLDEPNTFVGPQTIREPSAGANVLGLELADGSEGIYFKLPPLAVSTTYQLPFTDGLPNQTLSTDGSGNLFWASVGAGGGSGGPAYEVFQNVGSPLVQRSIGNFSNAFTLADNVGQVRTEIGLNFGTGSNQPAAGDDPRFSDPRDPLDHADTHGEGGSDPVTPESIGALSTNNGTMVGTNPAEPVLRVQGATGQTAALQEWRAGNGELVGLMTEQGSSFFREMGLAAKTGGTTVSQFFQIGGKSKFAFSAVDTTFDILRYDDTGAFKDRPLRIQRAGDMLANVGIQLVDPTVGSGRLRLTGDFVELKQVVSPPTPASTFHRLYIDEISGEVSVKKPSGQVVSLEREEVQGTFAEFVDAETPSGSVNGSNTDFTLGAAPSPAESLTLTRNGIVQELGNDFTLIGTTVTFLSGSVPQPGDTLRAWYRTSSYEAGGDLSGDFPAPTVSGIQGRDISVESPSDGECLAWNQSLAEWEPGPCAVVTDSLVWHFAGTPSSGVQTMVLTLPDGLSGVTIKDVRVVADSTGSSSTTYNIERCTSDCATTTPVFAPIYGADRTLAASTRTALAGTPDTATANGGEQFRINLVSVGTGVADVTVTLIFEHESFARLDLDFQPLSADCESVCLPLWEAAGMPQNPFGPPPRIGDACVCFGIAPPTRG